MRSFKIVLMLAVVLFIASDLFASQAPSDTKSTTSPSVSATKQIQREQPVELKVPRPGIYPERRVPGVFPTGTPGTSPSTDAACRNCDCAHFDYVRATDTAGDSGSCHNYFYPSAAVRDCIIDLDRSYTCRFKNNYPSTNPCPSATERTDIVGTTAYHCRSNTDITSAACHADYDVRTVVRRGEPYNQDQLMGYNFLLSCSKSVPPPVCLSGFSPRGSGGNDYMIVGRTNIEGADHLEYCCVVCND